MRNVIVEAEVSLDCVSDSENPEFWAEVFKFHSPDGVDYLNNLLLMPDVLLMAGGPMRALLRSGRIARVSRQTESTPCPSTLRHATCGSRSPGTRRL
jgi:hypothetical protein